jgi:hypothetical protein
LFAFGVAGKSRRWRDGGRRRGCIALRALDAASRGGVARCAVGGARHLQWALARRQPGRRSGDLTRGDFLLAFHAAHYVEEEIQVSPWMMSAEKIQGL